MLYKKLFHLRSFTGIRAIKRGKNRVLYTQRRAIYSDKYSQTTLSDGVRDESPPLATSGNSSAQNISIYKNGVYAGETSTNDYLLTQEFSIILNECTKLTRSSPKPFATQFITADTQRSDEKYEYFTEYGTQILGLFTTSGDCSYLSRNFERLTNQSAASQLGSNFFSMIHSDFREKLCDALHPSTASVATNNTKQTPSQILRLKMQHADGKYYWYQFTIHPQSQQYICLIENIHENMQAQNTLQKARLEAELALRARSEFLANMSHELRTPLNAVIGFSQIMEEGVFGKINNPQYTSYIRHIQESGYDLLAKIEDLLEIANIDAGRVVLEREEIYADDLIKHVMQTQSHHAQAAKISLSYVPKGNILLFIDRLKIQHILGHLVANSIKFNRAGGSATIQISRDGKNGIRFSIHDNGVGMNELKCHDIRESLQQDNCWTAKNCHHIGIGLALTKEFVALHGGEVEISSSAGMGTTISFTLPRDCLRLSSVRKIEYTKQLEIV